MPYCWGFAALLACWLLPFPWVGAIPSLEFPVNAQVPPVARTSQPYIFVFSDSTFASTDGPISYTLSEQPTWLQLISGTRTFSGTPGLQDAGEASFNLVATDSSGSTSTSVTFVVVTTSGLGVAQPVLPQLAKAGPISGPASLLLRPLQGFAFNFDAGTFTNTNADTEFCAVSANNTPLPNWIQFDSSSLGFSGTSPPLVSSTAAPQVYGIKLVASDVVGFSEATIELQLVVGYHILTSTDVFQAINISPGKEFSSTGFRNSLTLDSQTVADSDVISVTSNAPKWLCLDSRTISLHGTPPADVKSTNVTIIVLDVYGDDLNLLVELTTEPHYMAFFTGALPDANATAGDFFTYTINANLLSSKQVQISADFGSASTWLQFSPENLTLHGNVPRKVLAGPQTITLTATEGSISESKSFVIHIVSPPHTSSSSTRSASSTKTSKPSATEVEGSATSQPSPEGLFMPKSNTMKIVLGIILPALLIVLTICLILCWRRRRKRQRQRRRSISQEAMVTPEVRHTPTPEVAELPPVPINPERGPRRSTPSRPPQIELPWAPDSMRISKTRMSRRLRATPAASFDSSWGDFIVAETASALVRPPRPMCGVNAVEIVSQDEVPSLREVTPNYSRKRSTRSTQPMRQASVSKRSSKRYSTTSIVSPGLVQRLSGAGHGAGGAPLPVFSEARSSWQTTLGTMPGLQKKRSTVVLNDFPSPPREPRSRDATTVLQTRSPNRPPQSTLRMVRNDSTRSSGLQKWYTDRARDRLEGSARFSSSSSRLSSSSRVLWEDSLGGRVMSATLLSGNESSNRNTQQVSSGLARWRTTSIQRLGIPFSYVRTPSKLRRDVSTASSGQFDSAMSVDSWEDENLIEEESEEGITQWKRSEAGDTSPQPPFEAVPAPPQGVASPILQPRRWRLADNRNPGSLADRQTRRSEMSGHGSSAFV
jgi:axial budding pattern protein 2